MLLRRPAVAIVVTLVTSVASAAQHPLTAPRAVGHPQPSPRLERLAAWLDAVEQHQPGETDSALMFAGTLSINDVHELWRDADPLLRMLGAPGAQTFNASRGLTVFTSVDYSDDELDYLRALADRVKERGSANDLVKRGALLHADVVTLMRPRSESTWSPSRGTPEGLVLDLADGEARGLNLFAPHLELGRTLLERVRPTPAADATVRAWYRATLAFLHGNERFDLPHAADAVSLFPRDSEILLQAGCLHEVLAGAKVQLTLRSAKLPSSVELQVGSASVELTRAQRLFEQALRADPDLGEARVRLGRVLSLQGEHRAAVRELQRALASTSEKLLRYYGQLFLGSAEEALRNPTAARAAYQRAIELYPRAQSPHLALGRLAPAAAGSNDALRQVEAVLRLPADEERHDPWWTYHIASGRSAEALLSQLRGQFSSSERE